jgi:hypothetical protein
MYQEIINNFKAAIASNNIVLVEALIQANPNLVHTDLRPLD